MKITKKGIIDVSPEGKSAWAVGPMFAVEDKNFAVRTYYLAFAFGPKQAIMIIDRNKPTKVKN